MRSRLTYSNVLATIAVFVALGGSSYAATQLGKNEVKRKNIAPNAVNSAKVKNGSLLRKDFKRGQLPAGPQGPQGSQGPKGDTGAPGPLLDEVPSGKTLRGRWRVDFTVPAMNPQISGTTTVNYLFPMPEALTEHIAFGTLPEDVCPVVDDVLGAAPGHLCVKVTGTLGQGTPAVAPGTATVSDDRLGFEVNLPQGTTEPARYAASGIWAATAP